MKPFLVLAGGFGTRLRSLVSDVPKPLAPVAGKPFIVHLIQHWVAQGVDDFIFLLHYEAGKIEGMLDELLLRDEFSGVTFRVVVESTPLGTGGAILNAIDFYDITEGFMVANADTWLGSGVEELSVMKSAALAAVKVPNSQRYGSLKFSDGKVSSFEEKLTSIGQGYVNSGLYHLLPEVFDGFEVGSSFSIETEVFPRLVATRQLRAIKLTESFIDIGVPEDYLKFCKCVELGKMNGN
ncbi:MAG: sugar phosphate nucleotidyltransferase [Gammaproteobacteria bacterium]|nr:sugar phosphate nucleotidyltransferase [Gammaproteobacteria bacterium]